jgi:hypothetical protein
MKLKLAQFVAGLIIYFVFGIITIVIVGDDLENPWSYVIIWTLGMSLLHVLVLEPFRVRLVRKKEEQQKKQ